MALTITNLGTGSNIISASSALVGAVTASVNDVVLVTISAANSGSTGVSCISSVTDSAGNTYTQRISANQDPSGVDDGTTLGVYESLLTTALVAGTITVNYSPNCTVSSVLAQRIQAASGYFADYQSALGATATGDASTFGFTTGTLASGDLLFAFSSIETDDTFTADSDTSNGTWSTAYTNLVDLGGDTVCQFAVSQHKLITGSGPQTWNASTSGGTRDYAQGWRVYRETPNILKDCKGYWKLDESSGSATDSHGANTLTQTGTVGAGTGKVSGARDFSTSNYVSIASNAAIRTGDISFTLGCWCKFDSFGALRPLICKWSASGQNEYELAYSVGLGKMFFGVSAYGSDENYITADTYGTPSTGTWMFVVAWHDADENTINIQIDNGTVDSTYYESGVVAGTSAFQIGAKDTGGGSPKYMDGLIDEAFFFKRVLTSDERTTIYNGGSGLAYPLTGGGGPTYRRWATSFGMCTAGVIG